MKDSDSEIYSVSDVNRYIKEVLETSFVGYIMVEGEISQLQKSQLGHIYITLKDEKCSVRCTLWNSRVNNLDLEPEIGLKVIIKSKVSFYEKTGSYQLDIIGMSSTGAGEFHKLFEKLKLKLKNEGLFETKFKKELPIYPKNISIITSLTGSVLQDILKILDRRVTGINIEVFACNVQGKNCATSIIKQLVTINKKNTSDIIIIARGGGSLEDLIEYNNEYLARQIYNSKIPIITAIGHETDTTIADLVSDMRSATPSEAAEIATSVTSNDVQDSLNEYKNNLINIIKTHVNNLKYQLREKINVIDNNNPIIKINNYYQKIELFQEALRSKLLSNLIHEKNEINNFMIQLKNENPQTKIFELQSKLNNNKDFIKNLFLNIINSNKNSLNLKKNTIKDISPLNILDKGYSLIYSNGKIANKISNFKIKSDIKIRIKDGEVISSVKKITRLDH